MKTIVFMVSSYYPSYSAVGRCIGNIADVLEDEYNIKVICIKNHAMQICHEKLNGQNIYRVTTDTLSRRKKYIEQLKATKSLPTMLRLRFLIFVTRAQEYIKTIMSKTTISNSLVNAYRQQLECLSETVDAIIPACAPFEAVVAAMEYCKTHRKVDLIPILFDLFANNARLHRLRINQTIKMKSNLGLERMMFETSKAIFCVSNWREHIDKYFKKYKDKIHEIEHPLFLYRENAMYNTDENTIHIVYTGSLDRLNLNPRYIMETIRCIEKSNFVFDLYTSGNCTLTNQKGIDEIPTHIRLFDLVNSEDVINVMNRASILLSIGNRDTTQMPSKILEYISTGKPIIHFSYNEFDSTIKLLSKHRLALIINMSQNIRNSASKLTEFIEQNKYSVLSKREIQNIYIDASPSIVAESLHDVHHVANIVFAGVLLKNYVEPEFAIKLFSTSTLSKYSVLFYSSGSATRQLSIANRKNMHLMGWVSCEKLVQAYNSADVLLSIAEKQGKQVSSKIFEYMSLFKPILHIYYKDTDINLKYLRRYKYALCVKADNHRITQLSKEIDSFISEHITRSADRKEIKEAFWDCTPDCVAQTLSEYIDML